MGHYLRSLPSIGFQKGSDNTTADAVSQLPLPGLLVIDAYTKWLDVHVTSTSSSASSYVEVRKSFATYGLPKVIVSDNTANFTSEEFQTFLKSNGVKHVRKPPYHPASMVLWRGRCKSGLKRFKTGSDFVQDHASHLYCCVSNRAYGWS